MIYSVKDADLGIVTAQYLEAALQLAGSYPKQQCKNKARDPQGQAVRAVMNVNQEYIQIVMSREDSTFNQDRWKDPIKVNA